MLYGPGDVQVVLDVRSLEKYENFLSWSFCNFFKKCLSSFLQSSGLNYSSFLILFW